MILGRAIPAPDRARVPAETQPAKPASPCVCDKFKAGHYACLDCFLATEAS